LLAKKTKKLGATEKDSSSDSGDSDDDDSMMDKDEHRKKAIEDINDEVSGSEVSEDSDSEGEFKQDFGKRKDEGKKKDEGIMNLKFM